MCDAGAMSRGERVEDLDGASECDIERQRAFREAIGHRLALQVLHHEIRRTVVHAHVV